MALRRAIPVSNSGRRSTIEATIRKLGHLAPGEDKPITSITEERLNTLGAEYLKAYEDSVVALAKQTKSTEAAARSRLMVKMYISQFLQVFNFGIDREKYPLQDRSFYELSVTNGVVPILNTELEIVQWGKNIIKGDAERVAAGGAPMTNPSAEEFKVVFDQMIQNIQTQSSFKNSYDKAQEKLNNLNDAIDKLILRIWNEINTFYDDHEPASRRRKAREWGVVYVSTDTANIVGGSVLNLENDKAVGGALVSFAEIEMQTTTDSNGRFSFKTNYVGEATIVVEKTGFNIETYLTEIEEDRNMNVKIHLSPKS